MLISKNNETLITWICCDTLFIFLCPLEWVTNVNCVFRKTCVTLIDRRTNPYFVFPLCICVSRNALSRHDLNFQFYWQFSIAMVHSKQTYQVHWYLIIWVFKISSLFEDWTVCNSLLSRNFFSTYKHIKYAETDSWRDITMIKPTWKL